MYRLAVLCTLAVTPLALAQGPEKPRIDQMDRLARRLERDARELREEGLTHFRGRPAFRELEKHSREIEKLAAQIHKMTDRDARPRRIREALDRIDEEVRHLDRHVQELGRAKEIDRRAYDHVREELNDIGRTLYRMRREL